MTMKQLQKERAFKSLISTMKKTVANLDSMSIDTGDCVKLASLNLARAEAFMTNMEPTGPAIEAELTRLNAGQTVRVNDYELSNLILRTEQDKTPSLITAVMVLGALRDLRDARLNLQRFKNEYDPKHSSDCDCYGCRRFMRCLL